MTENEFARFIKTGLGVPDLTPTLSNRIAREVETRNHPHNPLRDSSRNHEAIRRSGARAISLRVGLTALVLAIIADANLGIAYYFPRYGVALANAPIVGGVSQTLLSSAGLVTADVSAASDVSTSSGHTLRLMGAYADGLQTVFLVQIDNQSLATAGWGNKKSTFLVARDMDLTDQFGHIYEVSTAGQFPQGVEVFKPLVSPAAGNGARLTLTVRSLGNVGTGEPVYGNWTLHATVFQHASHTIPAPTPLTLAGNIFTFESIRSSTILDIRWKVTGPSVAQAWSAQDKGSFASLSPFIPTLVGCPVASYGSGTGYGYNPSTRTMSSELRYTLTAPGTCVIRFGSAQLGFVDRTIVIPKP